MTTKTKYISSYVYNDKEDYITWTLFKEKKQNNNNNKRYVI